MAIVSSVLVLLVLIVIVVAPLVVGIRAARSNARYPYNTSIDHLFWRVFGSYFVLLGVLGAFLIATASAPHPDGVAAIVLAAVFGVASLPGSILPFILGLAVTLGWVARPFGLSNMSVWFVVGSICWQFFVIVGFRWQLQWRARGVARTLPSPVNDPEVVAAE
jgi:hypothetical protein